MSFSHEVKTEMCAVAVTDAAARLAELYGMLVFSRSMGPKAISLQTEHEGTSEVCKKLLGELFGAVPAVRTAARSDGGGLTTLTVGSGEAARIYRAFGYDEKTVSLRINRANIDSEDGAAAFLRGAFLVCGTVVDPGKDYHLEFVTPYYNLSRDLMSYMTELGFGAKATVRKASHVIYIKDSGGIEDLLTFMGATMCSLELMNVKIYKDIRNKANRVTNCETANITKTVDAAVAQTESIKKLMAAKGLGGLPDDLREVAELRIANPDMSLRELGRLLSTPLSRSGVNHRLGRLMEIAEAAQEKHGKAEPR